ncbi:hypothetical protein [Actinomadura roseirufa]|uniref:hypothetical protein n=1 Tax=Actinomadura roseirufa TaxID=2094049 RepID=UPI0010417873|nr:hypothetical protein [Actinomadura roseirufa]
MTKTPAPTPRGRHARPPSTVSVRWRRIATRSLGGRRRRAVLTGAAAASAALVAAGAVLGLPGGGGPEETPRAAVAAHTGRPVPSRTAAVTATEDPDEVPEALPYLQSKDPGKKVVGHVKEVRRSGEFIRIYTDLGEDDENSAPAVSLCEWATQFLKDGGDEEPRVFVHGSSSDNGSVILANKQDDKDDCEVPETP